MFGFGFVAAVCFRFWVVLGFYQFSVTLGGFRVILGGFGYFG